MFDHVSLKVRDFAKSLAFYRATLATLGYHARELDEAGRSVGFGRGGSTGLWLSEGPPGSSVHLAFQSYRREHVDAFYDVALGLGGKGHGQPGLRPGYGEGYYAGFVLDPDGNNVEAVFRENLNPVYYVGSYDITDSERFRQYPPLVAALLPEYGGEVLASDPSAHPLEGPTRSLNAIIRFPSKESALSLYGDPRYAEAKRIRQASTTQTSMVLAAQLSR